VFRHSFSIFVYVIKRTAIVSPPQEANCVTANDTTAVVSVGSF